tara:strand:+ start:28443 stop:28661 length:219 start_codon:yes stop_codon:yes gene_type:complete
MLEVSGREPSSRSFIVGGFVSFPAEAACGAVFKDTSLVLKFAASFLIFVTAVPAGLPLRGFHLVCACSDVGH